MPTYELKCRECGHAFERFFMRLLRAEDCVCPECGSTQVLRGVGGGIAAPIVSGGTAAQAGCGSGRFG